MKRIVVGSGCPPLARAHAASSAENIQQANAGAESAIRGFMGRSGEVWWLSGQRAAMRTRARKRDRQPFFVSGHGDCSRGRKWHPQSTFTRGFAPGPQEHLGLWFAHFACACPPTARPSPALRAAHRLRSLTLLVTCPPGLGRCAGPGSRSGSPTRAGAERRPAEPHREVPATAAKHAVRTTSWTRRIVHR